MHSLGYLLLAIGISNVLFGSFILLRNARDLTNLFFGGFVLAATLWAFGLAGYIFSTDDDTALNWAREYYLVAAAIPPLFLGFSLSFTHNWHKLKKEYFAVSLLPVIGVVLLVLGPGWLIKGLAYHDWGKEVVLNRNGYLLYSAYFVLFVAAAFVIIYKSLLNAAGLMRLNLKFIFIGMLAAFALGTTFNLFYPAVGNYRYIWVGPLSILVYIGVITYAIVRHRLFDIRLFVVRAVAYFLTFSLAALLFTIPTLTVTSYLTDIELHAGTLVMLAVATLIVAFLFEPLRTYFNRFTNRIFFRDYYDPQDVLDRLSSLLVGSVSVQDIEIQSAALLMETLKPGHFVYTLQRDKVSDDKAELVRLLSLKNFDVVVADEINTESQRELHQRMFANNVAMAVSLRTTQGVLGYMLLGHKQSGGAYSTQDKKLLSIAADDIAVGLQNALRFEQISQFNLTLKQKIEEATAELQKANVHLKELDTIKDEFISMATHQLGTPLAVIDGYLSMVLDDPAQKDNKNSDYLLHALHRVRLMKRLVADFLNVSRIDAGRFIIERTETDLNKLVPEELTQLSQKAREKGVMVEYVAPSKPVPLINIDESKTRQAIMNLIDNAIFYSPKGQVKVLLDNDGQNIIFKVVDNGIGVPESQKAKLFTKFMRADNAKKERPEGTGIGLYLVKRVVEDQNGTIIFNSQENKGSTFGFSLPLSGQKSPAPLQAPVTKIAVKDHEPVDEAESEEEKMPLTSPSSPAAPKAKKAIKKKYYTIQ
jgi:signal transduction histidine kinase